MDPERIARWGLICESLDRFRAGCVVIVPEGVKWKDGYKIRWPPGRGPDRDDARRRVLKALDHEKDRCKVFLVPPGQECDSGDEFPWPPATDASLFTMMEHRPVDELTGGDRQRQYSPMVLCHIRGLFEHVQRRLTVAEVCRGLDEANIHYQSVLVEDTVLTARDRGELSYDEDVWGRGFGLIEWVKED